MLNPHPTQVLWCGNEWPSEAEAWVYKVRMNGPHGWPLTRHNQAAALATAAAQIGVRTIVTMSMSLLFLFLQK